MLPFWLDLKSIHEFYFFIIFFYFFSFGPGNIFTFSHHNAFTLPGNKIYFDTIFLYFYILENVNIIVLIIIKNISIHIRTYKSLYPPPGGRSPPTQFKYII